MKRIQVGLALGVAIWSVASASAQQPTMNPFGSPGMYGYPVYPYPPMMPNTPPAPMYPYAMPPYGPMPPMMPTSPQAPSGGGPNGSGTGMMPNGPGMSMMPPGMMPNGQMLPPGMMPNGQMLPPGMMPNGQMLPPGMMPNGQMLPPGMMPNGQMLPPGMMPNGQMMPPTAMPFGSGVMPPTGPNRYPLATAPNGNTLPTPIPVDPRLPIGQRPPSSLPLQTDPGRRNLPTEPYYVQPDGSPVPPPASAKPDPKMLPETKPGNIVTEPLQRLVEFIQYGPSEPYTTYEGQRYLAEARQDNTRVWVQANYVHFWIRRDNTPPLVTTGNTNNPAAGTLGAADTVVVLGDGSIGPREFSGAQATIGMWLDPEKLQSLEISGLWFGKNGRSYAFTGDAAGVPPLAQPILITGVEGINAVSLPGFFTGSIAARNSVDFHALELNLARNVLRINGWSLDTIVGFRYLYLNDTLNMDQNITVLPAGAGFLFFNNAALPAGANLRVNDSFNMANRFYGGQVGARVSWTGCRFDLAAGFKIAFGATHRVAVINGSTTLTDFDTTLPGGALAQASNIGRNGSTGFSVVPEFNAAVGYQVTPRVRFLAGYTILDWSRIQRVGPAIDRQIDLTQSPTSATFVPGSVGTRPVFGGTLTDFWAQGINVGIELKY